MLPQHIQLSNLLHLPPVTAIAGQVKHPTFKNTERTLNKTEATHATHTAAAHTARAKKGGVASLLSCRDDCLAFWLIIPPLLIVPSLVCSVASLNLCPEP